MDLKAPGNTEEGVSFASRQIANMVKPDLLFSTDDQGLISMKSTTTFKTAEITFRLDEEFDETTPDDRQAKTVMSLIDGKLIQTQKWDGKCTTIEREIQEGKLIVKCIMNKVESKRTYERS
ncbi:fatty acid binding protein 4b isoform X2 [Trichomycterus rosablanca]|uniref:fatty acid binding protein 4b isoform X2 n=1 Tax=Trichomycterus rosablanca TaxID=2290929 RepID=UPI002F35FBDA